MASKPLFSLQSDTSFRDDFQLVTNWDDVICPICLDFPHNSVLLKCTSYEKGCRAIVCGTDHSHSNCLDRFIKAYGTVTPSTSDTIQPKISEESCKPACPLCRGEVSGWVIADKARHHLDGKPRHCAEEGCSFAGTYSELQKHARLEHPDSSPSKIDPAQLLDWENFQQSSEMVDVLSTIHTEVPRGVVLGDYVIEYGDGSGDEFEDFHRQSGNWWTSCIFYKVFKNLRKSRNRRRSRINNARRGSHHSSFNNSYSDEGSVVSVDVTEFRLDETDEEFVSANGTPRGSSGQHRSAWRRRTRFYDYT